MGCQPSLADDLTQETFVLVTGQPFSELHPAATFAYLRKTAVNALISHKRRTGWLRPIGNVAELHDGCNRPSGDRRTDSALDHLSAGLARLTSRQRLAIEMRFRHDCSRAEIAAALGITEHGARNILQRAKLLLREYVKKRLAGV
jgi:RNA polymerase sigma-70 factor (ECF subfamily)